MLLPGNREVGPTLGPAAEWMKFDVFIPRFTVDRSVV
jgi:hypothetical protein